MKLDKINPLAPPPEASFVVAFSRLELLALCVLAAGGLEACDEDCRAADAFPVEYVQRMLRAALEMEGSVQVHRELVIGFRNAAAAHRANLVKWHLSARGGAARFPAPPPPALEPTTPTNT